MVNPRTAPGNWWRGEVGKMAFLLVALIGLAAIPVRAAIQFDVFPGYDNVVSEACWTPMICEIKNDGPSFVGVVELSGGRFSDAQTRRLVVELPTGTLKRIDIPVFSIAPYQNSWDVRLLDEHGKIRAEAGKSPRNAAANTLLFGAMPRTATGLPELMTTVPQNEDYRPTSIRIQTALLPDNPLVFDGLDVIYLNSEKAADLNPHQVEALLSWLNDGGHLIVAVESLTDVNGVEWLRKIVPCDLADMRTLTSHPELQAWLRENPPPATAAQPVKPYRARNIRNSGNSYSNPYYELLNDTGFESSEIQVATGTLRSGGEVVVSAGGTPLMLLSRQGRGRVTTLMFSPEREPFRSWKNLPAMWSRLAEVPVEMLQPNYSANNYLRQSGWSIDGVFGAMVDSKQVRKLPVEYLLLLLIVYLVVIGPFDQYWLKRIRRPMLTWITFPCYVVIFSLLIYFIGYRLRAGETEWNELHLVDVLLKGEGAELRGRTYASVYSPVNATYKVESQEEYATFRGEFQTSWTTGGGTEGEHAEVAQNGDNFKANIFVPVWTSQLYVSDWWDAASLPLKLAISSDGTDYSVTAENLRDRPLSNAHLAVGDRIMDLGELPAGQKKTFKFGVASGNLLSAYVQQYGSGFRKAADQRMKAFGSSGGGRIDDLSNSSTAISFISHLADDRFVAPPGLDLSPLLDHGNAVLLAWEPDYSPIKPMNQFPTRRSHKDTLWRIAAPVVMNSSR